MQQRYCIPHSTLIPSNPIRPLIAPRCYIHLMWYFYISIFPNFVSFLFLLNFLSTTIFGKFETKSSIESIKVLCHQEEDVWVWWVFGGSAGKTGQKQETPHPQPPADLQRIIRSNKQIQIQIKIHKHI